jgi:zinc and cadmium transporter
MAIAILLILYWICVAAASLVGGALPVLVEITHRRMQFVMSFVGGLMLGVALLHLLPHSIAEQGSVDLAAGWTLGGLLTMFLLIRVFHVHSHEHGDVSDLVEGSHRPHEPHCEHNHEHSGSGHGQYSFSWLGLALGLSLHTLIDGLALGAAVMTETNQQTRFGLFGLATFLAVALHKPLDALSITSLMAAGGWSRAHIQIANACFALMCPLGVIGSVWGLNQLFGQQHLALGCALAFAAGVFLCIALADLLPEVAFHAHDRVWLTFALFAGITLAWGIGFLEPEHAHESHEHHAAETTAH